MTLYEIDNRISDVLRMKEEQRLSDDDIRDTLEALIMDKHDKCVNVALCIKNLMQDIEAFKKEENRLEARRESMERHVKWLKQYLTVSLNGATIEDDPRVRVTYRPSESVEIDNSDLIPDEFMQMPVLKPKPSKADIKEALQSGLDVPGVHLEWHPNIQIK